MATQFSIAIFVIIVGCTSELSSFPNDKWSTFYNDVKAPIDSSTRSDSPSTKPLLATSIRLVFHDCGVIFDVKRKLLYTIHKTEGLFKYSFDANAWNHHAGIQDLPSQIHRMMAYHAIAINDNQELFVYDGKTLATIQLMTKNTDTSANWDVTEYTSYFNRTSFGATGIIINNKFHIIGGSSVGEFKHLRYNPRTKKLDKLHSMSFGHPSLVKLTNKLVSFGGHGCCVFRTFRNYINEYDIMNDKWIESQTQMPKKMIVSGAVAVLNEQLILLFGGLTQKVHFVSFDDTKWVDDIWIYSLRDKTFKKSKLKCPSKGGGKVFSMNNSQRDQLSAFGYTRLQWSKCGLDDNLFPQKYLINIIENYYIDEWIHLLDRYGKHWKIDVFDIIDDV